MCVETKNYKFIRAVKVQENPEKSYRVIIGKNNDINTDGYYRICLENGLDAKSKGFKFFAYKQILNDIIYQTKKIEKYNNINFHDMPIIYANAIKGEISKKTDHYIKKRKKKWRLADKFAETWIKINLIQVIKHNKFNVIYTKVCNKNCKEYKSCLQRV